MDNIKTHNIDRNRLIEDLENNKYWIIFKNYLGEEITSEIPKDIFDAYIESKSAYKKNKNEEERHWEHIELSENELFRKSSQYQDSVENIIIKKEVERELHLAVQKLPRVQKNRLQKYYYDEKTEREIAAEEGIKHQAIHIGLDRSRKKLKIILKKFEN